MGKKIASDVEKIFHMVSGKSDDWPYLIEMEVENRSCGLIKSMESQKINEVKIIDVRSSDEGKTRHLLTIPSKQINKISSVLPITIARINKKETTLWFDSEDCDACSTILLFGSFLLSGRATYDTNLVFTFIAPDYEVFKTIITELEKKGFDPRILKVERFLSGRKTLTEKQDRVLWLALKMGFFEYPRRIHTKMLSQHLGVSLSTLSETMRRGLRNILDVHYSHARAVGSF